MADPSNSIELLQNDPLTLDASPTIDGGHMHNKFVQITPQRVRMRLRPGQEAKLVFRVAQAKQYPVDLYYLMDLSNSMTDDRDNIVKLGQDLAHSIQSITRDFQIGFGSFVDKEVMPFISMVPGDNCQREKCPRPYSFQHQMNLAPDAKLFQQKVRQAPISGNIDNPEGGFDALLQVMVCHKKVGWRKNSRRVIIFTTDQSFHVAMDGKLGGLVQPNDGKCHLNETGFYTYSTKQDYPSVGHINYLAKKHSVNIIWAVTKEKIGLYNNLSRIVSGSSAGIMSNDSSNVVQLVKQQYEAITTSIRVEVNNSANCQTVIKPKCKDQDSQGGCSNVELGTFVEFEMSVTLNKCVAENFSVSPVALNEQMVVEIVPICDCLCAKEPIVKKCRNDLCSGNGHPVCGVCQCCNGTYGAKCQCSGGTELDRRDPQANCRPPIRNGTIIRQGPLCYGRGECQCGKCICDSPRPGVFVTGKFCETICDNNACEFDIKGNLCSNHGKCVCGSCVCQPPWTGSNCGCRKKPDECRAPETPHLLCSGNGQCPCDKCQCTQDGYSGKYCEKCETCPQKCRQLRPCVECVAFGDPHLLINPQSSTEEQNKTRAECRKSCPFIYDELVPEEIEEDWNNCTFLYRNCKYTFSYSDFLPNGSGPENITVHLHPDEDLPEEERKLTCPAQVDLIGIVLGVIGCIVCVGLVTILLWKAFTTIHDRKEYARFEEERLNIKFPSHSNPIFRQATTTIQNPTFNPSDR